VQLGFHHGERLEIPVIVQELAVIRRRLSMGLLSL
jgi:hypothetical protein